MLCPTPSCHDCESCSRLLLGRVKNNLILKPIQHLRDGSYLAKIYPSFYHERWEEELTFDEQKTHQDPRRASKPANLRSLTPAGVIQELHALSLAHFAIRSLMFEAASVVGLDPDRLSFTGCFQILKCRLPECGSRTPQTFQAW